MTHWIGSEDNAIVFLLLFMICGLYKDLNINMSHSEAAKKPEDVEMKEEKKEVEQKKEDDPFFGNILLFIHKDRVQKGNGAAREGRQGQGQPTCGLVNQIIEEAQEGI